jgi:SAM-dependent methyltransferase
MTDERTELFRSSWSLYDAIISANYMFHCEIHTNVREVISTRARMGPYALLDLGCGNARGLAATLREHPPVRYLGVDLSRSALNEAAVELSGLEGAELCEQDMVSAVEELGRAGQRFDVVYSGFAMHHLMMREKERLFRMLGTRLKPGGFFLLVDVVREPGQSREAYLEGYLGMVRTEWRLLDEAQVVEVCRPVSGYDHPETVEDLVTMAREAGLGTWRRLGQHRQHGVMEFGMGTD